MQELEKILEEIIEQLKAEGCIIDDAAGNRAEEIIRQHTKDDGWVPVEERMPTKEECEKNQTGCIKFWITYGYRGNYSTLLANCKWVEADNEDGTTGDFAEFWVDQYPQIFYPSSNLIRGGEGVCVMCRECGNRTMSLVDGNTFGKPNGGALYRVVDKWNRRAGQEGEQNEKDL